MRLKSTSYAEYTWGDVRMLDTMCSAIFLRITPIFSMRTFSPGLKAGGGAIGAGRAAGDGDGDAAPDSTKARMSFFVTRPEMPVPLSWAMSMACSFAIARTTGELFVRRRSATVG